MDWRVRSVARLLFLGFLLALIECGTAEQRVVCYYTNWSVYRPGTAKFSPQNINPYLCTHLIYAFGGFTKENTLKPFDKYQDIEKGGYAKFTGLKTYNKNLKTMLAVGGWNEGSSRFSPMVADPERRKQFVRNTVKFLRQNHFDGLDLDWEYPAFRDGGKPRDRDNYASLVQELREAYERESSKTGRPRLLLTMAVPAGIEYLDKGYDIPKLNKYLDFINLLSYDYHSSYEPAVNHHSPLYPLEEDNEYNFDTELTVDYTIKYLLENGASADKIVLGIPTYGRSYTLFNEDATDIGSPADGPGEEGDATREKGYLAYYEICEALANSDEWEVVSPNPNAMGPYAFSGNQWVGYDDEAIVRLKAEYVTENGLGGIMFWSIDNDDFRGKCHSRPYPLIEAAKEAMLAGSEKTSVKEKSSRPTKTRTESNFIGRKLGAGRRTQTTEAPVVIRRGNLRKQTNALRPKNRPNNRDNTEEEETQVQVHNGRNGAQFYGEDEEDEDQTSNNSRIGSNVVGSVDNSEDQDRETPRAQSTNRAKTTLARRRRPANSRRRSTTAPSTSEQSEKRGGSNRITTPAPPTTPDPGTDFKCEDEGFFSHPRDCKKYFWCLDAGPGGLGIVAHHFTCPSGLVFNKAADSCDYPRNVVCPKTKAADTPATRAPIVAATSRATRISGSTRRPTSSTTPESNEYSDEYEYYDEEDGEEQVPVTTTTARNLQYKTLNRNRPSATTTTSAPTTTTQISKTTTSRSYQTIPSRSSTIDAITSLEESEEDPQVIQELIELIRKAGGIEELEKQLHLQGKGSDQSSGQSGSVTDAADVTPATISRSLYDRVLSRQAENSGNPLFRRTTVAPTTIPTEAPEKLDEQASAPQRSRPSFKNGPGQAQFEGLDDIPEVKSLRRERPQYVTINRQRPSTPLPDESSDEDVSDNTDGASSDETSAIVPPEPTQSTQSTQRETHGYVEIRRSRTTTTRSVMLDNEDEDETDVHNEPRRPAAASDTKTADANAEDESKDSRTVSEPVVTRRRNQFAAQEKASGTTSRYATIHRVRSTTQAPEETSSENGGETIDSIIKTRSDFPADVIVTSTPGDKVDDEISASETPDASPIAPETIINPISSTTSRTPESVLPTDLPYTTENVDLSTTPLPITEKVTEESSTVATTTVVSSHPAELVTKSSPATVAQPRPFGFNRRTRPTTTSGTTLAPSLETTPTSSSVSSDSGRVKVPSETVRLPTLKELIGLSTIVAHDYTTTTSPITLSIKNLLNDEVINREYMSETVAPTPEKTLILPAGETGIKQQVDIVEETQSNELEASQTNDYRNGREGNGFSNFDKASSATTKSSPVTLPIRVLKQGRNRSRRRRIKFVKVPVRILEADRPLTDVILEVPEYKLNRILKSLLRVEILSQDNVTSSSSEKSKTSNTYGRRIRYNSQRHESDELLSRSANTISVRAENQFTSTAPSISTVRGSLVLSTTENYDNRGFYVTKSIESTTPYENITPTTVTEVTELDNELIQSFSTTTEQLSTFKDHESGISTSATESYYTDYEESTSQQFSTTTEQLTNSNDNPSTTTEDVVSTTSGNYYTKAAVSESEDTWSSMISTSLENLNNILADNDDIDSSEVVTTADYSTSTEYPLSTTENGDNVDSTTTEPNFTESSDSGETVRSYSTEKFSNTIPDETSQPNLNEDVRTTTSKWEMDAITEDIDYHVGTSTVATDAPQASTTDPSSTSVSVTEISTSDLDVTGTSTVAPDDVQQTATNQIGDSTTESSTTLAYETTTAFSDSEETRDSTTQFSSTEASTTEFQNTVAYTEVYPSEEATTSISDEHLDNDSIFQTTTTESSNISTSSNLDQQSTTFSSIDQETTSSFDSTTVDLRTTVTDETVTDSGATDVEVEATTVIYSGAESTTTDSASTVTIPNPVDHESEVLNTDLKDSATPSSNADDIADDLTVEKGEKPKSVIESEQILTQVPKIFAPLDSTESGLPSRGFYRSPSAIPGKKNVRRRIIKKRIYGIRRPHIERISDNNTIRNFTKFGTNNKHRQRFIRRRIINHTTGKVVDQILTKDSFGELKNRTIIKANDNSSSNPESVERITNYRPEHNRNTVADKLLRLRASYRRGPEYNQKTNSSIKANIISSQNNSSASDDVQSSSVSSTKPNQRRRIVIKKFRYRSSGQVNSSTIRPSPSPSQSPSSNTESPLMTEAITEQNNNSTESTVEDKRKTISGQDYTDDTVDNLSMSGSETIRRISVYGSERQELPETDESNFEALEMSEEENSSGEINFFKNRGNSLRRPGTLLRPSRPTITTTSVPDNEITPTISPITKPPSNVAIRRRLRLGQRSSTASPNADAESRATPSSVGGTSKSGTDDDISKSSDQIEHAREVEVTVTTENPTSPNPPVSSSGRPRFRTSVRRRIIATTDRVPQRVAVSPTPNPKIVRQFRQRSKPFEKISESENQPTPAARERRPAIIDYDYYEDTEVGIVGKTKLYGKISYSDNGTIRCLDQGNFSHPTSCKKFITCSRMVNGQFTATEYTCPKRLSFDPIGGICNWSAGLGCKE